MRPTHRSMHILAANCVARQALISWATERLGRLRAMPSPPTQVTDNHAQNGTWRRRERFALSLGPLSSPAQKLIRRRTDMEIKRSGSQASHRGADEWFTGTVRVDPLFQA